jgi:hypothetical protein
MFSLPDWAPWWVPMAVLVPALLYLLVFLLMPFSLFGLKRRLEAIEARLDEIQGEIRSLVLRMPELRGRGIDWNELPPIAPARAEEDRPVRPPIPSAPVVAPRRSPVEPQHRGPPEPAYRAASVPNQPPLQAEPLGPGTGEEYAPPRRRPLIRPTRAARSEPRVDLPR